MFARTAYLSLALLVTSCTEPQFQDTSKACSGDDDCEPTGERDKDGGASEPPDAGRASPRDLLLGTYAVRAQFYGRDRTTQTVLTHEILLLAKITHDPERDKLSFEHQVCADRGEVIAEQGGLAMGVRALYPDRLPMRTLEVVYEGSTFYTVGPPVLFGYEATAPEACRPGRQIRRPVPAPWGTNCKCPLSDVPPNSSSDCRVNDADGDGEPGFTVQISGPLQANNSVRLKDMSQIVSGVIDPRRRHTGAFVRSAEEGFLECPQNNCRSTSLSLCPEEMNPVEFAPLDGPAPSGEPWRCADVVTEIEAGRLLPVRALAFPSGC